MSKTDELLTEIRSNLDSIITLLSRFDEIAKLDEREREIEAKQKVVQELIKKKSDLEERERLIVQKERVITRKEEEDRTRKLSLDARDTELQKKLEQVSKILGS